MEKIYNFILYTLATLILFSCGSTKVDDIVSESPDKKGKIKISASRSNSLDPFDVTINLSGYGQDRSITMQIFASNLSPENVLFDWKNNTDCVVTFIQQDDTKRVLYIRIDENGLKLNEVG
ncbi:MAG: hypothetical protein NZ529_01155 [Cytophagaceae bacterium]|nr:hypothetical protein [Cytophagaceae bacterium]MDW8455373.1 hypothetical protein [Cytophagaceae bacterium]